MNADELAIKALTAASNADKADYIYATTRYLNAVTMAAAELLLAGERQGEDAEALHTAALGRAKVSAKQYRSMANWKQEIVAAALRHMLGMTAPASPGMKRRGRPPKNGVAMTNAERQAAFQKRKSAAWNAIVSARVYIEQMRDGIENLESLIIEELDLTEEQVDALLEVYQHIKSAHVGAVGKLGLSFVWVDPTERF